MKASLRKFIPIMEKAYIKEEKLNPENELEKIFLEELEDAYNFLKELPDIEKYMVLLNLLATLKRIKDKQT